MEDCVISKALGKRVVEIEGTGITSFVKPSLLHNDYFAHGGLRRNGGKGEVLSTEGVPQKEKTLWSPSLKSEGSSAGEGFSQHWLPIGVRQRDRLDLN